MKPASNSKSLPDDRQAICNVETDEYFTGIKNELGQAERLVSDAVNNLVMNFRYISELSKAHHDMMLAIERMAVPVENTAVIKLLQQQVRSAEKIEQELSTAVTSLQFGDLVTQLLQHTTHQIDVLNVTLHRLDRDQGKQGGCYKKLSEIHDDISKAAVSVGQNSKNKQVVQQGMETGDVELF